MNKMMSRMKAMTNSAKGGNKASMRQMKGMIQRMGIDPRTMKF